MVTWLAHIPYIYISAFAAFLSRLLCHAYLPWEYRGRGDNTRKASRIIVGQVYTQNTSSVPESLHKLNSV